MAYYASFDARNLPSDVLTITKAGGGSNVVIAPRTMNYANGYLTQTTRFSAVLSNLWGGFDLAASLHLKTFSQYTFWEGLALTIRATAALLSWPSPDSFDITFNPSTRRVSFVYPTGITTITFGSDAMRRVFGFAADFSGSATTITGTQLPLYIIEPTLDGASSVSTVYEDETVTSLGYSSSGRSFSLSRTQVPLRRTWVQQYESLAKTFRRQAAAPPNEYTYQQLFSDSRCNLPFAVYSGFGDDSYSAYAFEQGAESFVPQPATPGSSDQFHIPFRAIALAQVLGLTMDGDPITFEGLPIDF